MRLRSWRAAEGQAIQDLEERRQSLETLWKHAQNIPLKKKLILDRPIASLGYEV